MGLDVEVTAAEGVLEDLGLYIGAGDVAGVFNTLLKIFVEGEFGKFHALSSCGVFGNVGLWP